MVDDRAVRFQPQYRTPPRTPTRRPSGASAPRTTFAPRVTTPPRTGVNPATAGQRVGTGLPSREETNRALGRGQNPATVGQRVGTGLPSREETNRALGRTPPPGGGPTPAPTQPMAPAYRGGGGGGGGAPRSMRDVDWFGSDAIFRSGAGGAQVSLQEQLANLLFENQQGYQDIDRTRRDWTQQRERGSQRTGEDFAARGLSQSGLYWQGLQDLLKDYEDSAGQINLREQNLGQQLGGRDPLSQLNAPAEETPMMEGGAAAARSASPMAMRSASPQGFTQGALFDQNYNALADVYGLLGQRGVSEGNRYQAALNQMRAQSAARSNQNIINTLGW
jgi:hypothetical protein